MRGRADAVRAAGRQWLAWGRSGAAAGVRAAVCPWALGGPTCMDRLFCLRWRDLNGSRGIMEAACTGSDGGSHVRLSKEGGAENDLWAPGLSKGHETRKSRRGARGAAPSAGGDRTQELLSRRLRNDHGYCYSAHMVTGPLLVHKRDDAGVSETFFFESGPVYHNLKAPWVP